MAVKFYLSAFADEAGGGILEQIDALKAHRMTHIEPRGLDHGNISLYTVEQAKELKKEYLAVVRGALSPENGEMRDLLFHDRRQNKTFVVERQRAGVKEALLEYDTIERLVTARGEECSLVHVLLHTGRTHQIRVQFASRGHSLLGDGKYGGRGDGRQIALFATRLAFLHPVTRKKMEFEATWDALGEILSQK